MKEAVSRKELYDLVWSKPMTQVAGEYGLSDRGLAKLCERNSIPVPPRGYWAKKAAGQKVKKAPLIVLEEKKPDTAILLSKDKPSISNVTSKKEKPPLPESIQEAIEREKLPENTIKVPATLHSPHVIVADWVKDREQRDRQNRGSVWHTPITPLDRRMWRLTSCLFKQMEARGFKIAEESVDRYRKETMIRYENDKVGFQIGERIKQYRRKLTDEEKKERYSSTQKWTQVRENTGLLEIILQPGGNSWSKVKIQEEEEKPFENILNDIVIQITEAIWDAKCQRLQSEENEKRRRQEEHERYERKKAAENEQKRKDNLEYKAQSWRRAQEIREYVGAVELARQQGKFQVDDGEFNTWKDWALAYADEIDFIANGNPLINLSGEPERLWNYGRQEFSGGNSYSSSNSPGWHPGQKWYHR